jgi:glyoxylase-like metal-dependent hydrolase (beta-lactamase superfamily II)
MKLFFHYCIQGFSNCYILGSEFPEGESGAARDAIIIDPGSMHAEILNFIEKNAYTLRGVLLTHEHRSHTGGLKTLKRIYDTDVYAVNHLIMDQRTILVKDEEYLRIGAFNVEVISVPGHSADSAVFKVDRLLFTGDVLTAGMVGTTVSSYGASVQMTALRSKIFALPGDFTVLPGHGPPSTLEAERRFNAGVERYTNMKSRRPQFFLTLN